MANCIGKFSSIQQPYLVNERNSEDSHKMKASTQRLTKKEDVGTNILERFLQNKGSIIAASQVKKIDNASTIDKPYTNDLRKKFRNNEAVIMGVIIRSLGAKNNAGNHLLREGDERGNFNNAVSRLDELKNLGVNTLHVLPIHPPGKNNALGTAGSVYAPLDFLKIDPALDDPKDPKNVKDEFKNFIKECHKRGISVMLDLPSCASFDLFNARPEIMAFEKDGTPKSPGGWVDIRTFNPWKDETKRELNPHLLQMHKDYVDMCIDLGVDGIRADVAREKPTEFWDIITKYARDKDPQFAWLAESYTYEQASPIINLQKDRPKDLLRAGFDSIYGQWHIFHDMKNASEVMDYVKDNINMSHELSSGKSLIGSFGTHDDVSIMTHGGVNYTNLVSGLQATLPMLNPYYFDGYQSGDYYLYDFEGQTDEQTETDTKECTVHKYKPDIFNYSRPLIGDYPQIGDFMKNTLDIRNNPKYHDILTKGSFIPLKVVENKDDQIIAFARHNKGKTLLVVANKDVNSPQAGIIRIPGLKSGEKLDNLFKAYGENSIFQADKDKINVELGKGRIHLFEIDTPNIEKSGLEVFRQL